MRTFCIEKVCEYGAWIVAGWPCSRIGIGEIPIAGGEALTSVVHQLQLDGDREAPRKKVVRLKKPRKNRRHYCTAVTGPQW